MTSEQLIKIDFNGESVSVDAGSNIDKFLASQQLGMGRFVVVKNDEIVPRSAYAETALADGDTLEIMSPISGG